MPGAVRTMRNGGVPPVLYRQAGQAKHMNRISNYTGGYLLRVSVPLALRGHPAPSGPVPVPAPPCRSQLTRRGRGRFRSTLARTMFVPAAAVAVAPPPGLELTSQSAVGGSVRLEQLPQPLVQVRPVSLPCWSVRMLRP